MLTIDQHGQVLNPRIRVDIKPNIERGQLRQVSGIIVHQTGGSTAESALNSYAKPQAKGTHFLIDKDGTIYQTASMFKQTIHVGPLRARCLAEMRCTPAEFKALKKHRPTEEHNREKKKPVTDRYPANHDSVGIELVGQAFPLNETDSDKRTYEAVTKEQSDSFQWLLLELRMTLGVPLTEVFRHPTVSRKNKTEAATATW